MFWCEGCFGSNSKAYEENDETVLGASDRLKDISKELTLKDRNFNGKEEILC